MLTLDIGRRLADNGRMYGAAVGVRKCAARGRSNCHLYHYAGNNPVRYTDPDGREIFDSHWWYRNKEELAGLFFDSIEVVTGVYGSGVTCGVSLVMTIQGVSNITWKLLKITITSVIDEIDGSKKADYVDNLFADSALGAVLYCIAWCITKMDNTTGFRNDSFKKMAGRIGDCLDMAIGLASSRCMSGDIQKELSTIPKSEQTVLQKALILNDSFFFTRLGEEVYQKLMDALLINDTSNSIYDYYGD
ncbi:MAG: hypothetical protein IJU95_05800 [Treponema sp.]|nr:hypothetical protein [Treponema sp.]